jgi:peptidoglycan hydrolase-like protein with peptidoglycan-binding domain
MNKNHFFTKSSLINKFIVATIITTLFTGPLAYASGVKSFSAPDTTITQTKDSIVILYDQKTKMQTIIIDPSYSGGSSLAAYLFATPSKPTFFEAPKTTFADLEKLVSATTMVSTGSTTVVTPVIPTTSPLPTASSTSASDAILNSILGTAVTADGQAVIPTVAPVQTTPAPTATTLPVVTSATATVEAATTATYIPTSETKTITDWLTKRNLPYTLTDLQNFSYYKAKSGYYMVTIKSASVGTVQGISFTSPFPVLPIRLLTDNNATTNSTLEVYAISETPLYVPATKILVSKELTDFKPTTYPTGTKASGMDFGTAFSVKGKWLSHSEITINPKTIASDLFMSLGTNKLKVVPGSAVQVSAAGVKTSKAVVAADSSIPVWDPTKTITQAEVAADPTAHPYAALISAKRTLQAGLSGNDVKSLQTFLRDFIDITIKPDGKWGPKTSKAVETFQEAFSLKKDGRVGPQTRSMIDLIPISEIIKREQEVKAQIDTAATAVNTATAAINTAAGTPTTPAAATATATATTSSSAVTTPATNTPGYSLDSLMEIIQEAGGTTPEVTPEPIGTGPGGSIIGGGSTTTPTTPAQ